MKKFLVLILAVALFSLAGCEGGVDTSTDPENMIDTYAMEQEREEESRLQEALKDLCPYDRSEWE